MPIIYTYPSVTPTAADLLLISSNADATTPNVTSKCTVQDVVNLVTALVPGGGTVTSINVAGGTSGLTFTGEAVTTTGTITITGGTLDETYGGTGNTGYAVGDILYASGASVLSKLVAGSNTEVLTLAGGVPTWAAPTTGTMTSWTLAGDSGTPQTVSDGETATIDISGGALTSVAGATRTVTIGLPAYTGTTNVGYVPTGGTASEFLTGAGTWVAGETYDLNATTSGADVNVNLTSTSGTDNSVVKLTAGTNITLTRLSGVEVQIDAASPSSGIYSGSGSLSGATTVTTGVNDLTFTATTGDIIFNNNVAPNPALFLDGATNSVGIGGNTTLTDQLSVYNSTATNTSAAGVYGLNTTGNQMGVTINMSGAATSNVALKLAATGAGTNYGIVTTSGDNGFGTATPEGILHTADATATNILQRGVNDATGTNLYIRKSRGTVGSEANVVTADNIGTISFRPYYGDFDNTAVSITAEVEGTLAADTTPGKLVFGTAAAGANTTTDAMVIDSAQKVGIGTLTPSANADLTLEGGALAIKETTTPTADTNYGKIYCKADNKLYFQDGAGAEHEIAFV